MQGKTWESYQRASLKGLLRRWKSTILWIFCQCNYPF